MIKILYLFITLTLSIMASMASKIEVTTINPIPNIMPLTIEAKGEVINLNKIQITAKTEGILNLLVLENSYIKKGDIVGVVSDKRRDRELDFLKSKMNILNKQILTQKKKIDIAKDKYKMGVGAKNDYLSEEIGLEQIKIEKNSNKKRYETLLLEHQNSKITSPKSGFIVGIIPQNSYITYGKRVANIIDSKRVIKLFVDMQYAKELKRGMSVILSSSYQNGKGKIIDILPKSRDNLIEIIVNPNREFPLNMQLNAKIILKEFKGLEIPKKSIVLVENHPAVYIIKDNIAHIKFIEILKDKVDRALIKNNFKSNSKIAFKNAYMLSDGVEVNNQLSKLSLKEE